MKFLLSHHTKMMVKALSCAFWMAFLTLQSSYAAFMVSPIRVELTQQQKIVSLQVSNSSAEEISIQIDLFEWKQNQEQESQNRISRDILVTPPIFKLAPQQTQVLRVGLRRPSDLTQELSYRLFIKEIAKPLPEGFQGFQMIQQISLPVFVQPQQAAQAQLVWKLSSDKDQQLKLSVENTGAAHTQMTHLSLKFENGEILKQQGNFYVLPQGILSWKIPRKAKSQMGESAELSISTAKGIVKQQIIIEN